MTKFDQFNPGSWHLICKATQCMKSHLTPEEEQENDRELRATMVNRKNPDTEGGPLMSSVEAFGILHAGANIDMLALLGMDRESLPKGTSIIPTEPEEVFLHAEWRDQEQAVSGRDANVFGALGVLTIPQEWETLQIPRMNAINVPKTFLEKYGVELLPLDTPFELEPALHPSLEKLYLIEYEFRKGYIEEYVLKMTGGGGVFVERHPFPHVFVPLSEECTGAIIVGRPFGENQFCFTSLEVPFGYMLRMKSDVIHGDSFFEGPYAIALTETELADSVLIRKDTPTRDIEPICQIIVPPVRDALWREARLAHEVNRKMLAEKRRHEQEINAHPPSFHR